jgi:hypothetical protein
LDKAKYSSADDYLSEITLRLRANGFVINNNIIYKNQTFDCVAKRTMYEIDKFGFVATFFIFARFPSLDIVSLKDYSRKSFKYAEHASGIPIAGGIPLPRGFFFGVWCYSVAIVDDVDTYISETIRSKAPPKHLAACEIPVIYSLASGTLYYYEVSPYWGNFYHNQNRQTINNMLAP